MSVPELCLILAVIIEALFLSAPILDPLRCVPYLIKFLMPLKIDTLGFNS